VERGQSSGDKRGKEALREERGRGGG